MFRIIDGRDTGKTGRLFLLAKEQHGTILCSNAYALKEKAIAYGITGINFCSFADYFSAKDATELPPGPYFVDELEMFVEYSLQNKKCALGFNGYTLSTD